MSLVSVCCRSCAERAGRRGWSEGYGNETYDSGLKTDRSITGRLRARGNCAVWREAGETAGLTACEASLCRVREGADALELKKEARTLQSFCPLRAIKGFHTGKLQDQQKKVKLKC